ncbi:phosphoethanolamine transferase [Hydrogenophaga sp. OTU3427]|uniref:phosphoethanolamine transferase n=1 Tax=Hydrogenophaga sp. OTU3427 TaxID=3043856 RepID=UPI00313F39DE
MTASPSATHPRTPIHPHRPRHSLWVVGALALWLATLGNLPLWRALWALPDLAGPRGLAFMAGTALFLAAALLVLLAPLAWPRLTKPLGLLCLAMAAGSSHFMLAYGVVIDPGMMTNTLQTDAREVRDLLSPALLWTLTWGLLLPGAWLLRQRLARLPWGRQLRHNLIAAGLALVAAIGLLLAGFQDLAPLMRNHKSLRYMVNPFNTVWSTARALAGPASLAPLQALGTDARVTAPLPTPPLLVLVVGETARAANFALGGYPRDTTPQLRALQATGDLTYFSNVRSCGTSTQASLPCMFSHLGREAFVDSKERFENLLDVLDHAGLAVLWVDNQSGCKGLCERVARTETRALDVPGLCQDGECFDEVMLHGLDDRIAQLDPSKRARGVVLVLHQMGSHGPAYFKRAPAAFKHFKPECESNALQQCGRESVVNAYDNSIRYTDHFLARTVAWLQQHTQPSAMLYVSDHGESLGENNLYLHGLPYALAPDEQKHVPMVAWLSPALRQARGWPANCLSAAAAQPLSHDHLFHSMLGLAGVTTQVKRAELDLFARCGAG